MVSGDVLSSTGVSFDEAQTSKINIGALNN